MDGTGSSSSRTPGLYCAMKRETHRRRAPSLALGFSNRLGWDGVTQQQDTRPLLCDGKGDMQEESTIPGTGFQLPVWMGQGHSAAGHLPSTLRWEGRHRGGEHHLWYRDPASDVDRIGPSGSRTHDLYCAMKRETQSRRAPSLALGSSFQCGWDGVIQQQDTRPLLCDGKGDTQEESTISGTGIQLQARMGQGHSSAGHTASTVRWEGRNTGGEHHPWHWDPASSVDGTG
ncbi:hypothetical protein NDU88_005365 [Pleurodeles waltl]|uniref:Uncharacterized protein n=1 Tax=Pleurodeles waltl TaxID=8319 RepID=A0AAV7V3X7_PLEWA|nr:hypothetical protein NDU88_005365 [Pleurodeles waltl]